MRFVVVLLSIFGVFLLFGCTVSINPADLAPAKNYVQLPPVLDSNNTGVDKNTSPIVLPDSNTFISSDQNTPPQPQGIVLSLTEVAKHAIKQDCWMILNNKVYDLTTYVGHPGGNVYTVYCGKDGTASYTGANGDYRHSKFADSLLAQFYVGTLGDTIISKGQ